MNNTTLFLCIGCIIFSLFIYQPIFDIEQPTYEVFFCPKDNCTKIIHTTINLSSSIKCAFYDLDDPQLTQLLGEKNATVFVDYDTKTTYGTRLKTPGLMHHKFCILDDTTTITGSTNPTKNGLTLNRNNLIIIQSEKIAKEYLKEFRELEQGVYRGGGTSTHPDIYVCPEDMCEERIVEAIDDAEFEIKIMAFTFTSQRIANHLILAQQRGITVSVIFEQRQRSFWQADMLAYQDIPTYVYKQKGVLHHKTFIIDNGVYTGSYNPTNAGNEKNEENIIFIDEPTIVQQFNQEFIDVLALSQPLNST